MVPLIRIFGIVEIVISYGLRQSLGSLAAWHLKGTDMLILATAYLNGRWKLLACSLFLADQSQTSPRIPPIECVGKVNKSPGQALFNSLEQM